MTRRLLTLLVVFSATAAFAAPSANSGPWIQLAPTEQCIWCANGLHDCFEMAPVYDAVQRDGFLHLTEFFVDAVSTETGLPVRGLWSVTSHWNDEEVKKHMSLHWRRADGFRVQIIYDLVYYYEYNETESSKLKIVCEP